MMMTDPDVFQFFGWNRRYGAYTPPIAFSFEWKPQLAARSGSFR